MKLTTTVELPVYPFRLSYADSSLWTGSCFAATIGDTMRRLRFDCCVNPFGALYNPLSIVAGLRLLMADARLSANDLFASKGLWHSFMFHGSCSRGDRNASIAAMNAALESASEALHRSKYLFITFGTACVFEHRQSGAVVGNCHKLPATDFVKRRLAVNEIVAATQSLLSDLQASNPELKTIFTLSPIRHFAEGAQGNALSKATLRLAIDEIVNTQPETRFYFPAYEILLDELRDYRFYASDLCHPSDLARDYIWDRFASALISPEARPAMHSIHKLNQALAHRPLHPEGDEHEAFLEYISRLESTLQRPAASVPNVGDALPDSRAGRP